MKTFQSFLSLGASTIKFNFLPSEVARTVVPSPRTRIFRTRDAAGARKGVQRCSAVSWVEDLLPIIITVFGSVATAAPNIVAVAQDQVLQQ